ncbi:meiosis 1 arrest protein [Ambystoma mexicanum]|uniref:meiosis 1 arrest protein n=1 Tax=Ambystoma mexicanum TaxID=8296 RepID=UPI0037E72900
MNSSRLLSELCAGGYTGRPLPGMTHGRQPPRILIVDVLPPFWSSTCNSICEALENFFSVACSLGGPCRIPLLSVYAAQTQHECLLPFMQLKGSFQRLHTCISELRAVPREGSFNPKSECLKRAVQDGLQQFKQHFRLLGTGGGISSCSVEITVLTSQPGRQVVRDLEAGLKDTDLVSLRRLQVIHLSKGELLESVEMEWMSHSSEEASPEGTSILGADIDLQTIGNDVVSIETFFKAWLLDHGTDREHLHLLLPGGELPALQRNNLTCVKCDVQERLLDPDLLPSTGRDANAPCKMATGQAMSLWKFRVIKALKAEGVCESVLYGLPLILRPTCCWKLDWDDLEANQQSFQALCHCLLKKDLVLLAKNEPQTMGPTWSVTIHGYYVIAPSPSFTLMAKPVVTRELLLPCDFPAMAEDLPEAAVSKMQSVLNNLEVETTYNPLHLQNNLYKHLRGLLARAPPTRPQAPPQAIQREQRSQPRQLFRQNPVKARATVAPLPMIHAPPRLPTTGFKPDAFAKESGDLSLFSDDDEFLDGL